MDYRPTSCYFVASVNSGDGHQVIRPQTPGGQKNTRHNRYQASPSAKQKEALSICFSDQLLQNELCAFLLAVCWPKSHFMERGQLKLRLGKKCPHAHTPLQLSSTDLNYYPPHPVASAEVSFRNRVDACILQEVIQKRWGKSTFCSPTSPFDLLAPGVLPTLNYPPSHLIKTSFHSEVLPPFC